VAAAPVAAVPFAGERFEPAAPADAQLRVAVPQARDSVELVFRDGTRVQLPEGEAAAFQRLAGGLASREPHNNDTN